MLQTCLNISKIKNLELTSVDFLDFVESFDFFLSLGDFLTLRQALLIHRLGARADGCGFDGREPILKTSNFQKKKCLNLFFSISVTFQHHYRVLSVIQAQNLDSLHF